VRNNKNERPNFTGLSFLLASLYRLLTFIIMENIREKESDAEEEFSPSSSANEIANDSDAPCVANFLLALAFSKPDPPVAKKTSTSKDSTVQRGKAAVSIISSEIPQSSHVKLPGNWTYQSLKNYILGGGDPPLDKIFSFSFDQMTDIPPSETDVLCGRGRGNFSHIGNLKMLENIRAKKIMYERADRHGKSKIGRAVMFDVLIQGGRFIKAAKAGKKTQWQTLSYKVSQEKIMHCIRDQISFQRKQSESGLGHANKKRKYNSTLLNGKSEVPIVPKNQKRKASKKTEPSIKKTKNEPKQGIFYDAEEITGASPKQASDLRPLRMPPNTLLQINLQGLRRKAESVEELVTKPAQVKTSNIASLAILGKGPQARYRDEEKVTRLDSDETPPTTNISGLSTKTKICATKDVVPDQNCSEQLEASKDDPPTNKANSMKDKNKVTEAAAVTSSPQYILNPNIRMQQAAMKIHPPIQRITVQNGMLKFHQSHQAISVHGEDTAGSLYIPGALSQKPLSIQDTASQHIVLQRAAALVATGSARQPFLIQNAKTAAQSTSITDHIRRSRTAPGYF
jgi:hypothetical protein